MDRINEFLSERKNSGLLRNLKPASLRGGGNIRIEGRDYLDFSSNDYLGLSTHPKLKNAATIALEHFGPGAGASRLLSGDLDIHHELEEKTALLKGKDCALVFNSGYQANVGLLSALYHRGDVIFSDRLNHASIIDGVALSGARLCRFRHNDMEHLRYLLEQERHKFKEALIITETIFSMDGDRAPLSDLVNLKESFNCFLMVDEAHATGIFGDTGGGVVEQDGLSEHVDLIMGTFSKALGSFGAYLACSSQVRDYLINSCRGFIYSTALPAPVIAANIASLGLLEEEPFRRKNLLSNAGFFRESLAIHGFDVKGCSQIIPVVTGTIEKAVDLSGKLRERGYWILPITPPTVAKGESRIRVSITYHHTKNVLRKLVSDFTEINNI